MINIKVSKLTERYLKELFSKASPPSKPTLLAPNLSDLDKLRVNVTIKNNLTSQVIISSQTNVQSKAALDVLYFTELVGLILTRKYIY